jgi:membrane-bound lytic murein transglycosylase MltF
MTDAPRLGWVNAKAHPQGNGGRKNRSGYAEEHEQANFDENIRRHEEVSIGGISENSAIPTDVGKER